MSWLEGTIEGFRGSNPKHRDLRKVRTDPQQEWPDLHFFHLDLGRSAGYPDAALAPGQLIRFQPDPEADTPRVGSFAPYSAAEGEASLPNQGTFLNPYHFIPLFEPPQSSLVGLQDHLRVTHPHDRFARADGEHAAYSGRILCRLTTEGPVVIGAQQVQPDEQQETEVAPFTLPNPRAPHDQGRHRPAIPGSTLRGLLSSLVEAASCSSLRVLSERRPTRRADVNTEALSAVGRIEKHGDAYRLRPLTVSVQELNVSGESIARERCRVHLQGYRHDAAGATKLAGSFLDSRQPESHSASNDEYWYIDLESSRWKRSRGHLLGLVTEEAPIDEVEWTGKSEDERRRYTRGVLLVLGLDGSKAKTLPRQKKYEYFLPFPPPPEDQEHESATLEIPAAVLDEFAQLLADAALIHGRDATDFPFLHAGRKRTKGSLAARAGDLVYFEQDPASKAVTRLSFSAIWRRPILGENIHGSVQRFSRHLVPFHSGRQLLTLAERLFGFVERDGSRALAGRVRVGHGLAEGEPEGGEWYDLRDGQPVTLKILASPKPPSPALYFGHHGYLSKTDLDLSRHHPHGRKVYLHHRDEAVEGRCYETNEPGQKRQLKLKVKPLKNRTSFLFHVDFTNLSREELGLLLYALRPTKEFRHKIGLGKPIGLGRVVIDPLALGFVDREAIYAGDGLFAPRYASLEWSPEVPAPDWTSLPPFVAQRYRDERRGQAAATTSGDRFPRADELRQEVRNAIPERVCWALELLGDPAQVEAEVTYPVLEGHGSEGEHFQWFVKNDKRHRKAMPAIRPDDGLPTLKRYPPPPKKPKAAHRDRGSGGGSPRRR